MAVTAADRAQGKNCAQPVRGPGFKPPEKEYILHMCVCICYMYIYINYMCVLQMQMNVYYMCIPYVYTLYVTCVYHMYICVSAFVCGYNFFMEGLRM